MLPPTLASDDIPHFSQRPNRQVLDLLNQCSRVGHPCKADEDPQRDAVPQSSHEGSAVHHHVRCRSNASLRYQDDVARRVLFLRDIARLLRFIFQSWIQYYDAVCSMQVQVFQQHRRSTLGHGRRRHQCIQIGALEQVCRCLAATGLALVLDQRWIHVQYAQTDPEARVTHPLATYETSAQSKP